MGAMVGKAILRKSVEPYVREDEELLSVTAVRRKGGLISKWTWNCLDVSPPGIDLSKRMAVVATSRRILILATDGRLVDEAKRVLVEAPIAEVSSVDVAHGTLASEVSWTVSGRRYLVAAKRADVRTLADALQRASAAPFG